MIGYTIAFAVIFAEIVNGSLRRETYFAQTTSDPSLDYTTTSLNLTVLNSTCWVNGMCNVAADLTRVHLNFKFSVVINCNETVTTRNGYRNSFPEQYSKIPQIALDGCSVNREDTLGVEFVPDPASVRSLSIRMFRIAGDIAPDTFVAYDHLESLELLDNIIGGVSNDSFQGLSALKSMSISNSDLQYLDDAAFTKMPKLIYLTIREPLLNMSAFLVLPDLVKLVVEVKRLEWWDRLPLSLEHLYVSKTRVRLFSDEMEAISNLSKIQTFHLTQSNVTEWPRIESNSLQCLNLSHNLMRSLSAHDLPLLHIYDISFNQVKEITELTTRSMHKLRFFFAQHNRLETVAPNAFVQNAYLETINLIGNRLRHIAPMLSAQQDVQIQIDGNDWGCRWALDMSTSYPQVFSHFRYAKALDSLNIRGLRCQFFDQPPHPGGRVPPNLVTFPTGVPTYVRRNPKDTAILTLIILVVGVAFLFLLLFLHIKCRKDGLQSFNRFLPMDSPRQRLADRTDFVRRELPTTDAYEVPICRRNTLPMDEQETEKRLTDEGFVYEEIPDRKEVSAMLVDCDVDTKLDAVDPSNIIDMATFFEKFHISDPTTNS